MNSILLGSVIVMFCGVYGIWVDVVWANDEPQRQSTSLVHSQDPQYHAHELETSTNLKDIWADQSVGEDEKGCEKGWLRWEGPITRHEQK
jgi:hypothetical protein